MIKIFYNYLLSFFLICILSITVFLESQPIYACTAIATRYKKKYLVGRNFDWPDSRAFIVISPKGAQHMSQNLLFKKDHLKWNSHYGSATFHLVDKKGNMIRNAVLGGINAAGFSASALWLQSSIYPKFPRQPIIATGLWVQYMLDNAKTVKEAIQLAQHINIEPTVFHGAKILLHLFIHDAYGDTAIMEYIKGKLMIYHHRSLPNPVLTNDPYQKSIVSLKQNNMCLCDNTLHNSFNSRVRFVRAVYFLKILPKAISTQQAIAFTFKLLGIISEPPGSQWPTVWSVVYNSMNKTLYYRTINNPNIKSVHLINFDFSKRQPFKIININNPYFGNIDSHFKTLN